jgi:hypothetical protein
MGMNLNKLILPVPKSAAFKMDDYIACAAQWYSMMMGY